MAAAARHDQAAMGSRIPGWPPCERAGCRTTVRDGGLCTPCAETAAGTSCEAFLRDTSGEAATPPWQRCATCGARRTHHRPDAGGLLAAAPAGAVDWCPTCREGKPLADDGGPRTWSCGHELGKVYACTHRSCWDYEKAGVPACRYPAHVPTTAPADTVPGLPPAKLTEPHAYLQRDPRPTSAAAAKAVTLRSGTQRVRVLASLADAAVDGMGLTDEEGQQLTGLHPNSYTARRLELVEAGYVEDTGDTRPTTSGQRAVVWLPSLDGLTALDLATNGVTA